MSGPVLYFWAGYASGVMSGVLLVLVVRWWIKGVERKFLSDVSNKRKPPR